MSKVGGDRGCFTEPTLVLGEDPEDVGVANNEVRDNAAGTVIALQDREPELFGGSFFFLISPHVEAARSLFQNASLPSSQLGLTPDFLSAFCTVYPRSAALPVSCGGVHSRVALEPQTSTNLIL